MRPAARHAFLSVFVAGIALCASVAPGMTAELEPLQRAGTIGLGELDEPAVSFPMEGSYFLGYRGFSSEDSLQAARYLYPHSSISFGLDLLYCPLPYRYNMHAEFLSPYDFYADAGFAYKDLLLFRDIMVGVHHNLPYSGENPGEEYYLDFASNLLSLRLKAPDFPLHAFVNHRHIEREGKIEQRFLLGGFDSLTLVSRPREIDWKSDALKLGLNSHAGPVEIEYAYDQSKFNPGLHNIIYDEYPAIFARPSDIYPHAVVAETETSGHTVRLHSSYTGGFVAAATLASLSEKNNYSLSKATTRKGALDLSWIPDPALGLFFKYRHRSVDMESPEAVLLTGLQGNTLSYPVRRRGISHDRDLFSLATRYRPAKNLSLFATYEFSHLSRKEIDAWGVLPGHTLVHRLNLAAHVSPRADLKAKATYEYKSYSQPGYNNTPDHSSTLRLTTDYTPAPAPWLSLHMEYLLAVTERTGLRYLNSDLSLLELGESSGRRDQFLASLSSELSPRATVTASWFYQRRELKQDLAYRRWFDLPYIDANVPYTDEASSFSLAFHFLPREDITVSGDAVYTTSKGATGYNDVVGGAPFSLASFSALHTTESGFSLGVDKRFAKSWEIGLRSYLGIHDNKSNDSLDGEVLTVMFRMKRFF